jgi:hypothetical protein
MLTYSEITENGRLGNQLFQYAALRSIGIIKNIPIGFTQFPEKSFDGGDTVFCFNVIKNIFKGNIKYKFDPIFEFDKRFFDIADETNLSGFFQSYKYFHNIRDILLKEFVPSDANKIAAVGQYLKQINPHREPICAIHFRRGDYLEKVGVHPPCDRRYYMQAMILPEIRNMKKVILTDDKEWCRYNYPSIPVSNLSSNTEDLWLMKNCDAVVMANSSFSWWGAYLGKNTKVVAPRNWFGHEARGIITRDIYMPHWKII